MPPDSGTSTSFTTDDCVTNSPTFDIDVNFDIGVSSLAAFLSRKEPKNSSNFRFSVLCEFEFSVWSNP